MDSQETLDWLSLRLIAGVGSVRFARLLEAFGSPGRALAASPAELERVRGVGEEVARDIKARRYLADPQEELTRLEKIGAGVVTWADDDYPQLLKAVPASPPLLFVRGGLACCREAGVAVVGSRKASPYGRKVARELGEELARAGVCLVSGLARGVDACAHRGCLEEGGLTVGVLGCGLDVPYPRENQGLAGRMAGQGAVISEFPLGTPPAAGNFPVRNRIISGLCRAVVVVEGGIKSGSLITARHALDQGREVFAVPGPVMSPQSEGSHQLIRQGAALYTRPEDVLGEDWREEGLRARAQGAPLPELTPKAGALLDLLDHEPRQMDLLTRESGLSAQEVSALLMELELAGLAQELPGKNFVRA